MIDQERISDLCDRLGLGTMATHLPHVADEAARNELSFTEFFERLLHVEHRERQERSRTLLTPRRAVHSGPPRGHFKVDQAGWVILGRDWLGQGRSLPIGPA